MTETSPPLESGGLAAEAVESAPKAGPMRRIRVTDFHTAKQQHERWAMLTSYDQYTAALFDEAGVWALLVGDSAANNVYGYDTTLPVTVDELLPLVRAVVKSTKRAFVIGDLPFGSYEDGPSQALETSIRFMKEGGCHAVKFEGGYASQPRSARSPTPASPSWATSGSPHKVSTSSGAIECKVVAMMRSGCWTMRTPSKTPEPSAWCWRWFLVIWRAR